MLFYYFSIFFPLWFPSSSPNPQLYIGLKIYEFFSTFRTPPTTVWQKIWVKNDLRFCDSHEPSSGKSSLERFLKKEKNSKVFCFILHKELFRLVWFTFWKHFVNLDKIPFYLIGRTIWFGSKMKFAYFRPLL